MAYKLIDETYCPYVNASRKEFICDTDADFNDLPECCLGSAAVSIDSGNVMIVNTSGEWVAFGEGKDPNADTGIVGTWVFNDEITNLAEPGENIDIAINLMSYESFDFNGGQYHTLYFDGISSYLGYSRNGPGATAYDFITNTWSAEGYKTIVILGESTSEASTNEAFITWLKANATKVG